MANAYTENLRLNQWAATDSFVRTEFNQDNRILDTAFSALEARAALLERQLEPMGYQIYSLLLQNYYDGKYTGLKKGLIFDGFQDASMLAALTPGAYHDQTAKQVRILSAGAADIDTGFCLAEGADGDVTHSNSYKWISQSDSGHKAEDLTFTPGGYGVLNSVRLRLAQGSPPTAHIVKVQVLEGDTVCSESGAVTVNNGNQLAKDYTFSFPGGVALKGLGAYKLRIFNTTGTYYLCVVRDRNQQNMGAVFSITPSHHTTGSITTPVSNIGRDYDKALCWVRHTGAVEVLIKAGGSAFLPMARISARPACAQDGTFCTESLYRLDTAPAAPNSAVTVKLNLNTGGGSCTVYDYGVMLL